MSCKNVCIKFQVHALGPNRKYYGNCRKRCSRCYIYISWNGSRCPCCHSPLRTKSRNGRFKKVEKV